MYDQEIIEKKPSSPLATSLLGTACVCLIASIVILGMKLSYFNQGNTADAGVTQSADNWQRKSVKLDGELDAILKK